MEILKLEYDATGPSIRASVPAMNDSGTVLVGVPNPETTITMSELVEMDPSVALAFRSLLEALEPLVRKRAEGDASDPRKVQAQANQNAREREALRLELLAIEEARAQAARELASARAALAELAEIKARESDAESA